MGIMMSANTNRLRMQGDAMNMARLADLLSMPLGRPVVDKTGLTGAYDIALEFSPEGLGMMRAGPGPMMMGPPPGGGPAGAGPGTEAPRDANDSGPTIFTALQEQLGLKLESRKGPVELLVVDSVEKMPTEN